MMSPKQFSDKVKKIMIQYPTIKKIEVHYGWIYHVEFHMRRLVTQNTDLGAVMFTNGVQVGIQCLAVRYFTDQEIVVGADDVNRMSARTCQVCGAPGDVCGTEPINSFSVDEFCYCDHHRKIRGVNLRLR